MSASGTINELMHCMAKPSANRPFTYPVQPLKVELLNRLDGDKLRRRTRHSLGSLPRPMSMPIVTMTLMLEVARFSRPHAGFRLRGARARRVHPITSLISEADMKFMKARGGPVAWRALACAQTPVLRGNPSKAKTQMPRLG